MYKIHSKLHCIWHEKLLVLLEYEYRTKEERSDATYSVRRSCARPETG